MVNFLVVQKCSSIFFTQGSIALCTKQSTHGTSTITEDIFFKNTKE